VNPISKGISWKYQKNKHIIDSLIFRNAPAFVYQPNPLPPENEIPVFTFHTALPDWFEEQCLHLADNGYHTLSASEFLDILTTPGRRVKKSILLTFDDGLKHVWTVAYPLLKKYNLKATCFLIPGCIPENNQQVRPTLEDYWREEASLKEIVALGRGDSALATWAEIKIMHESGVIDFQSHTMYHHLVFASNKIFDFVHPGYDAHYYGNVLLPLYAQNGQDVISREPLMGMPVYFARPRMSAERRFFDDEAVRDRCLETVQREGPENFFGQKNWRKVLHQVIADHKAKETVKERHETPEERDQSVYDDLLTAKKMIEEKLPGKEVTHLCYPWYEAEDFAVQASRRARYQVNYFGQLGGKPTNRPGDDPFKTVRVEEAFLKRLPGRGRDSIRDVFKRMVGLKNLPELLEIVQEQAV
jgi:hypothetical protein